MSEPKLVKDQPLYDVLSLYIGKTVALYEFYDNKNNMREDVLSIFKADNGNEGWMLGNFPDGAYVIFTPSSISKVEALPLANSLNIYLRD
jgi:hypothetical protein